MSAKANWQRWIKSSIAKHFDTNKSTLYLQVDGFYRPPTEASERMELRIDQDYDEQSEDQWEVMVYINVLITTIKTFSDEYKLERNIGIVMDALTKSIQVQKYGDDDSYFGCLQRSRDKITVTNFGCIEKTTDVLQTTVEADYRLFI